MRDYKFYLKDIIYCIEKIKKFTQGISKAEFKKSELIQDAVIRNLEIIGEAVKKIPEEIRKIIRIYNWYIQTVNINGLNYGFEIRSKPVSIYIK